MGQTERLYNAHVSIHAAAAVFPVAIHHRRVEGSDPDGMGGAAAELHDADPLGKKIAPTAAAAAVCQQQIAQRLHIHGVPQAVKVHKVLDRVKMLAAFAVGGGKDERTAFPLQPDDPFKMMERVGIVFEVVAALTVVFDRGGSRIDGAVIEGTAEAADPAVGKGDHRGFPLLGHQYLLHSVQIVAFKTAFSVKDKRKRLAVQHQQKRQKDVDLPHACELGEKSCRGGVALIGIKPPVGIHGHGAAAPALDAPQQTAADLAPAFGNAALGRTAARALPAHSAVFKDRQQVFSFDDPIDHMGPIGDMLIRRGHPCPLGGGAFIDDGAIRLFSQQIITVLPDMAKTRPFFMVQAVDPAKGAGAPAPGKMQLSRRIQPDKDRAAVLERDQLPDILPLLHPFVAQIPGIAAAYDRPCRGKAGGGFRNGGDLFDILPARYTVTYGIVFSGGNNGAILPQT